LQRSIWKIILGIFLVPLMLAASSLSEKYPSYRYVFSEFDVDESYIDSESFKHFVHHNEKSIKWFYTHSVKRAKGIVPLVKGYLVDQGLSDLFIYLSMVESGLSTEVVSSKKAVGLWQFMPQTALRYKLEVCKGYDERCDPVSSTQAAIRYLNKLHEEFGKWYLAAIAYNCGEGRLKNAIRRAGSDTLEVLTDEYNRYLPRETRDYIRKILLIAMLGEGEDLDFPVVRKEKNRLMQVEISGGCDLGKLARTLEMQPAMLLNLNRQFKEGVVPQERIHYTITIPEEKMMRFYLYYHERERKPLSNPCLLSHLVQMGETLESIARKYHTQVKAIEETNSLNTPNLEVDTLLLVPVDREQFEKQLQKLR